MPLIILGMTTVSLGSYWYINDIIKDELSRSMLALVEKSAESINRWLKTIMIEPEIVATTPAAKNINQDFASLDQQNINRHIFLRNKYPDIFQDIYAANSKGEYHTVQQHGNTYSQFVGDIQNREYFRSIMAGGPSQITPPLISRTTGVPTIFMVSPIVDDRNTPQGLIGAGISLEYIQQIAEELKAGETGYGFIIAQDGTYIYHPRKEFILRKSMTELDDPTGHELSKKMVSGESGMFRYTEAGISMIAFYHPIPISGWSVASVLPAAELYAPAAKMIRVLMVVTIVFVLLTGFAIFLATERLTTPLRTLAAQTREIASGNLDVQGIEITSRDEIGMVSESFNIMTKNLVKTLTGLRESEDKYRSIFENAVDGIFQSSLDGALINANPACARMLGLELRPDLLSQYTDLQHQLYVNPEDRTRFIQILLERGKILDHEVQFYKPNGEIFWVSVNATLLRDDNGVPQHIVGMISDITSRKKIEAERESLQQQLVQAQKLEAVGQLAGGVAHDFNNMLAVILGLTELALLKTQPSDQFHTTFLEIQKAANHSADHTRQLLTFARKQTVAPKVINLNESIDNTLNMLSRLIGEDIELVTNPGAKLWNVNVDPAQINQILTNLCVNARDAISGIGKIIIQTGNVMFDADSCHSIQEGRPGEFVCLSVADNGCGMNEETKLHIFEPFFSARNDNLGTGLGLATVYGIVKQNNAFIDIESEPAKGTTIRIYLPRHQGEENKTTPPVIREEIQPGDETILLVEDEPEILNITRQMLEGLGYTVHATTLPNEALQLAEELDSSIDIFMSDVIMPTMNGRELSERISEIRPGIKCLFMSGYTADIIATRGILKEGVRFIEKPFTLETLAQKVQETVTAH